MPTLPEGTNWDLEAPGSRFSSRPAFGLPRGEQDWPGDLATDDVWAGIVRAEYGAWLLDEEDPTLGKATLVRGEIGRGASAEMAVVEWLLEPIVKGVIQWVGVKAVKRVWQRARTGEEGETPTDEADTPKPRSVLVNRGTAILLAAAAVQETFGEEGELALEAAEEPSAIAGRPTMEPNYVGLEPWVVLLRSQDARTRYVVVVEAHGDILGCLKTPMNEWESLYFYLGDE
jgi:hypothetical protein